MTTNSLLRFFLSAILSATLLACGGARRRGGGPGPGTDAGSMVGSDSSIVLVDSSSPGADSGGGSPDSGGGRVDAGGPVDAGRDAGRDSGPTCMVDPPMHYDDAYCAASTRTCIEGCDPMAGCSWYNDCVLADPSTDCAACVNLNADYCAYNGGCDDEFEALICCAEAAGCTSGDCPACESQSDAYGACVDSILETDPCFTDSAWVFDCF